MSEEIINESGNESGSESEVDSIDLLMESYVNLLELFRELAKDVRKNREMLEEIAASFKQIERNL